jgi:hypothetical protein
MRPCRAQTNDLQITKRPGRLVRPAGSSARVAGRPCRRFAARNLLTSTAWPSDDEGAVIPTAPSGHPLYTICTQPLRHIDPQ